MAGSISPDVHNLAIGKGFILFKPEGDETFYHVGNVPTFTFTPKITNLDHFSSMEGTRKKDFSIVLEKSGEVKMDMEELTARNLAMLVLGDIDTNEAGETEVSIFSRASLTGELKYYATNEVGPRWYVDLLSVQFTPSGDFNPIGDTFAKLSVTGTVQSVDGVFGTMTLKGDVSTLPPENVLVPFITGAVEEGQVLTCNLGGWIGAQSFAYAWTVGDTTPGGTPVDEKTYTVVAADVGKTVKCTVTATNTIGSTEVASGATAAATNLPVNIERPYITGTPQQGVEMTAHPGTWADADTFTYSWKVAGSNPAAGATTTATFTPGAGDVGKTAVVTVVGVNENGSSAGVASLTTAAIAAP